MQGAFGKMLLCKLNKLGTARKGEYYEKVTGNHSGPGSGAEPVRL